MQMRGGVPGEKSDWEGRFGHRQRRPPRGKRIAREELWIVMDLPEDEDWCPRVQQWWQAWQDDPRTAKCTDVDWLYLLNGAILQQAVWGYNDYTQIRELRAHEKAFEARLKELNGEATSPVEQVATPAVAMIDKYRKRKKTA